MISDFQILGIEPTRDASAIKAAYRKRAKEIHPDINQAQFDNHMRFIVLQKAYRRLLAAAEQGAPLGAADTAKAAKARAPVAKSSTQTVVQAPKRQAASQVVAAKDPAYAFYKAGIKVYSQLHPSYWNEKPKRVLIALEEKDWQELREMAAKVGQLVKTLPQAYYYFSLVANDYPESVWAHDARVKLGIIEQQTIRYRKIIESFTSHATLAPRVNKMF